MPALAGAAIFLAATAQGATLRVQTAGAPEAIGSLVGDDVVVKGAVSFDVANGRSTALLASGSEITIRSGKARIDLGEGDTIALCGPAHLTLIKAGGTLTIALDYGEVHPQLTSATPLTVYMPLIVATPVAIGQGPRDLTIGLDQSGDLCVLPARGAVRVEQQLGGQGMLVPQGGQVSFTGGELNTVRNMVGACSCELLVLAETPKKQFALSLAVQPPVQPANKPGDPPATPAAETDVPIYRISVPLVFDARAPRPPAMDPPTILVEEEARLRPQIDFQGDVRPAPPSPPPAPPQPVRAAKAKSRKADSAAAKKPGLLKRFFNVFRWERV